MFDGVKTYWRLDDEQVSAHGICPAQEQLSSNVGRGKAEQICLHSLAAYQGWPYLSVENMAN